MDGSELSAKAFGAMFPVFSMFVRIQGLVIQSLALALAVAFVVMLLSINVWVAVMIGAIVIMVDADLLAGIYFFNNNLAPFTFAAVSSSTAPHCLARPTADRRCSGRCSDFNDCARNNAPLGISRPDVTALIFNRW